MDVMERCRKTGVVPVVVLEHASQAIDTANALLAGGVDIMEITMRTDAALDSIKLVSEQCPDMLVGAGTVINAKMAEECVAAGAKFIVSPGFDEELVKWCVDNQIPVLPGCVTPAEIMQGLKLGIKIFKFFPAGIYGGIKAMKNLSGPFPGIQFVPTGGVNGENLQEYLEEKSILAVGGSWLCSKSDISAGNFEKIKELALQASQTVAKVRG